MDDGISFQSAFNVVGGILLAFFGWLLNTFWSNQKDNTKNHDALKEKVNNLEVNMVGSFMKREEFAAHMAKIEGALERIESKLDGKADK